MNKMVKKVWDLEYDQETYWKTERWCLPCLTEPLTVTISDAASEAHCVLNCYALSYNGLDKEHIDEWSGQTLSDVRTVLRGYVHTADKCRPNF